MLLKNAMVYTLINPIEPNATLLNDLCEVEKSNDCGKSQMETWGWHSPESWNGVFIREVEGKIIICLRKHVRVIDLGAINELADKTIKEIEKAEGRKTFRKERKQIKEDVLISKMPSALTKSALIFGYIDTVQNRIVIDTNSTKTAEKFLNVLRETLGGLSVEPWSPPINLQREMSAWLALKTKEPGELVIQGDCSLEDQDNGKITLSNQDLDCDEVRDLINGGMTVVNLRLMVPGAIFTLYSDFTIRKIKWLDEVILANDNLEDQDSLFAADFIISYTVINNLLKLITDMSENKAVINQIPEEHEIEEF